MKARSVEELEKMEQALYDECWTDGKLTLASEEYYQDQMLLLEEAFATLFPDAYDYHTRYRSQQDNENENQQG